MGGVECLDLMKTNGVPREVGREAKTEVQGGEKERKSGRKERSKNSRGGEDEEERKEGQRKEVTGGKE